MDFNGVQTVQGPNKSFLDKRKTWTSWMTWGCINYQQKFNYSFNTVNPDI